MKKYEITYKITEVFVFKVEAETEEELENKIESIIEQDYDDLSQFHYDSTDNLDIKEL